MLLCANSINHNQKRINQSQYISKWKNIRVNNNISNKYETISIILLITFNIFEQCINIFSSIIRLNPDDTVPDLMALEHCQVKHEYDLHIPPYGMAYWLLRGIDLPFCQSSY